MKIVGLKDVEVLKLSGRDMRLAISKETLHAKNLSGGVIWVQPGSVVKPCHAHLESEEVLFIIRGRGEIWVDGELSPVEADDFVLFSEGSKHMLRNTGSEVMQVLFVFGPPTDPSKYVSYPEVEFPHEKTNPATR